MVEQVRLSIEYRIHRTHFIHCHRNPFGDIFLVRATYLMDSLLNIKYLLFNAPIKVFKKLNLYKSGYYNIQSSQKNKQNPFPHGEREHV